MLEYIYCNKIELNEDLALELLEPADRFLLSDLRDGCEKFLVKCLNPENFVKIANLTTDFETRYLAEGIIEYIKINSAILRKREIQKNFKTKMQNTSEIPNFQNALKYQNTSKCFTFFQIFRILVRRFFYVFWGFQAINQSIKFQAFSTDFSEKA